MKLKVMILIGMIQSFSLACAMHTNSTIAVCDNPPCANIVPMPFSPSVFASSAISEKKSFLQKPEKSSAVDFWNPSRQTKEEWLMMCVQQAAQEEICLREEEAAPMSKYIEQQDTQWPLGKWAGLCTNSRYRFYSTQAIVEELNEVYKYFTPEQWNPCGVITALMDPESTASSMRINHLLGRLSMTKINKYHLGSIRSWPYEYAPIRGSTIDEFFDEKILFPDLPKIFQQWLQGYIENLYRCSYMKDNPSGSLVFHALLTALRNSNGDPQEIQALQESSTFKKYELDTKNAFAKYMAEHQDEVKPVDKYYGIYILSFLSIFSIANS